MHSINFRVINLERRTDRRRAFERWNGQNPCVTFEFVKAVDAATLDMSEVCSRGLLAKGSNIRVGHLACALSHREILLRACSRDQPSFVCEDDVVFRNDFAEQWRNLQGRLPKAWDYVLLGYNFDSGISMELIPGVQSFRAGFDNRPIDDEAIELFQNCSQPVLVTKLENAFGTPAYAVSPAGAARILNTCFPLRNEEFVVPALGRRLRASSIDSLMNNYFRHWGAFAAFPPLAVPVNDKSLSDTERPPPGHPSVPE